MTDNRTTELRRKLTELGKSYSTIDGKHKNTTWQVGELTWWYDENTETGKTVLFTPKQYNVTPEQAIAATLGYEVNPDGLPVGLTISEDGNLLNWRGENYVKKSTLGDGTLTAEQVREAVERHVKFYEGGDYDEQAIADELNATLGTDDGSRWFELFGTPERTAESLEHMCQFTHGGEICERCRLYLFNDCDMELRVMSDMTIKKQLLEWLRGKAVKR